MRFFSNFRGDLSGGLTAAVVALPLALAFGVASGAGPIAGLYGAIAVGFFAALFGGTPSQVSGPTGPMTVVMTAILAQYQHDPALAFTVVSMGGAFQVLFGIFGFGRYIIYMPYPVISGFMSGIGIIIMSLQVGPLLGHGNDGHVIHALTALPGQIFAPVWPALVLGLAAFFFMIFWPKKLRRIVPPPLAALTAGTLLGILVLSGAPVLGDVPQGFPVPHIPAFTMKALPGMMSAAIMLALLGSVDSLLTSLVADNFTRTQHKSDRELIGQGIGNFVSGLIGGLPGAGATMRTVVNIRAGGRTGLSGAVHALALLACMMGLGFLVEDIPKAVLAGILLKIGWDIIDWGFLKRLWRAGFLKGADRQAEIVMLTVMVLTVFVDLIMAVAIGVIIQSLMTARQLATHQIEDVHFVAAGGKSGVRHRLSAEEEIILEQAGGKLLLLRFTGPLSFGTARDLTTRMQTAYSGYSRVVIDLTDTRMMDISIMMALADMIDMLVAQKCRIFVSGTGNAVYEAMKGHDVFAKVPSAQHYAQRLDALKAATASL